MRRAAQATTLALITILAITGCGGSSDSATNVVTNPPAPPEDGINGQVASAISGATLSVTDATGEDIVLASGRTTDANGNFSLVFSEFAIEAGITAPLLISLDGTNATAICDFDDEGNNDCLSADGSFVSFGERFTLPDGFRLRALIPEFPSEDSAAPRTVSVNLSVASELAASYISNQAALSLPEVLTANQQALGVVEFITGLSTAGKPINEIQVINLAGNDNGAANTASLALALMGASLHGRVTTEVAGLANYRQVLSQTTSRIRPVNGSPDNLLRATGSFLAEVVTSFLTTATTYQTSLPEASPVLSGAIAGQTNALPLLTLAASGNVSIALPADPDSTDAIDRARTFVSRLSESIGASLLISNVDGFGGTATGAATVFSDQQQLINSLVSTELRATITQLDRAVTSAFANKETQLTGTNVSGVLSFDGSTTNLSSATSSSSNIQTGISVNLTIQEATRSNTGENGELVASQISISVARTQNDVTTQQLYNGALTLQMTSSTNGTDTQGLQYSGELRSVGSLEFSGEISVSNLSPSGTTPIAGDYTSDFTFTSGTRVAMSGAFESQLLQYSISSGTSTVMADLVTNVITDMTTSLNLAIDEAGQVSGGAIVASQETAATMDKAGIITYSDGTTTSLPAPVI